MLPFITDLGRFWRSQRLSMLMNSINGHSHTGGVVLGHIRGETLWELNSGFSGDATAKANLHSKDFRQI